VQVKKLHIYVHAAVASN